MPGPALAARIRPVSAEPSRRLSRPGSDRRGLVPAAARPASAPMRSAAQAAPRVREHEAQPLGRIGGVERHVGAAGLEDRRAGRRPAPASARAQIADQRLRADAQARAGGGPAGWPARSSSRVGQPLVAADRAPRRPACARPAPRTARGSAAVAGYGGRARRSTPPGAAARSAAVSSGSSARRPLRVRDDRVRAAAGSGRPGARPSPRRTGRWCTPGSPLKPAAGARPDDRLRSNFAVPDVGAPADRGSDPAAPSAARRRVLRART